jgi:hypothetical protein
MKQRVHALEGYSAVGYRYFTCGKVGRPGGTNHVGIAHIKALTGPWERVNCRNCQRALERRYGITLVAS